MARLTGTSLSLAARGGIRRAIVFQSWKGIFYARKKPRPHYHKTTACLRRNIIFADAVKCWQVLGDIEKMLWRAASHGMRLSGYELFLKDYLEHHQ